MISAMAFGNVAAMPTPTIIRAPTNASALGAKPHSTVPTARTLAPARNTSRWP